MEKSIRALNVLSGVILLAAGVHIQVTFWPILSPAIQGLLGVSLWLYFFIQVDLYSTKKRNNRESIWR